MLVNSSVRFLPSASASVLSWATPRDPAHKKGALKAPLDVFSGSFISHSRRARVFLRKLSPLRVHHLRRKPDS